MAFEQPFVGPLRDVRDENGLTLVQKHGRLQARGSKIYNQLGAIPKLNGMSMFWSQWMGQFWNADAINFLVKDWKVQIIRAAMAVNQGGYTENPDREKGKLTAVVDACIANGIYVIIDWHIEGQNTQFAGQAKSFFAEMAQKYGAEDHVLYEGWNEPTSQSWDGELKPYHESILAAIRPHTKNLYIAGNPGWSSEADAACNNRLKDDNVAYTLHFYAATHGGERRNKYDGVLANGCAVVVTEWGTCEASGSGRVDEASANAWLAWTTANGISTANWGVYDKAESCAALNPGASATGGWSDSDLTQSGRFMKGFLTGKAPAPGPGPGPSPSGGCCSWGGNCRSFRDWCDESAGNCSTCNGEYKPSGGGGKGGSCCGWGGKCRSFRDWCDESASNCATCDGQYQ